MLELLIALTHLHACRIGVQTLLVMCLEIQYVKRDLEEYANVNNLSKPVLIGRIPGSNKLLNKHCDLVWLMSEVYIDVSTLAITLKWPAMIKISPPYSRKEWMSLLDNPDKSDTLKHF